MATADEQKQRAVFDDTDEPDDDTDDDNQHQNHQQADNNSSMMIEERRPLPLSAAFDDSRRLFQRLWTDDDEIKILQGFFEFTSKRGTTFASHQHDTGPFYEDIKKQLNLDFSKNQLVEKLRRLKKKYRNCATRMRAKDYAFKSPHERAIYDIARNIWSASVKRARDTDDDDYDVDDFNANDNNDASLSSDRMGASRSTQRRQKLRRRMVEEAAAAAAAGATTTTAAAGVVAPENTAAPAMHTPLQSVATAGVAGIGEETVKNCLSPLFKEFINSAISPFHSGPASGTSCFNVLPLSIAVPDTVTASKGKWKEQQILELEVYLKRIELVRDHVKSTLEELKSSNR